MKAIVLGATGFIGSHLVRALNREGIEVRIVRRRSSAGLVLQGLTFEEVVGDLDDFASLKEAFVGCQVLFHAAGYYPLYSFDRERQRAKARRQMEHVIRAAEAARLERVIYTSSMSTIGRRKDGQLSDEETPYDSRRQTGLYYEIKHELEQKILGAIQLGFPAVIVNPTGVFGDYDVKPTSGTLVVSVARGLVPLIADAPMNVVDVRDVASSQVAALHMGKVGRRYILGGHNTTLWETAQIIAKRAKVRPPMARIPLQFLEVAAVGSEYLGRYLLHQERPLVPQVGIDFLRNGTHYDTTRARQELGLKSTPMEETFDRALHWFRAHQYI